MQISLPGRRRRRRAPRLVLPIPGGRVRTSGRPIWVLGGDMRPLLYCLPADRADMPTHVVWHCVVSRAVASITHRWNVMAPQAAHTLLVSEFRGVFALVAWQGWPVFHAWLAQNFVSHLTPFLPSGNVVGPRLGAELRRCCLPRRRRVRASSTRSGPGMAVRSVLKQRLIASAGCGAMASTADRTEVQKQRRRTD